MSSKGALTDNEDYVKGLYEKIYDFPTRLFFFRSPTGVIKYAEKYSDFVIGFISQSRLTTANKYLHCTPGKLMKIFFCFVEIIIDLY